MGISADKMVLSYRFLTDEGGVTRKIPTPKRFLPKNGKPMKSWIINNKRVPNGCLVEMARTIITITEIFVQKIEHITYKEIRAEGFYSDYPDNLGDCNCVGPDNNCKKCSLRKDLLCEESEFRDSWNKFEKKEHAWTYLNVPYVFAYKFEKRDCEVTYA